MPDPNSRTGKIPVPIFRQDYSELAESNPPPTLPEFGAPEALTGVVPDVKDAIAGHDVTLKSQSDDDAAPRNQEGR